MTAYTKSLSSSFNIDPPWLRQHLLISSLGSGPPHFFLPTHARFHRIAEPKQGARQRLTCANNRSQHRNWKRSRNGPYIRSSMGSNNLLLVLVWDGDDSLCCDLSRKMQQDKRKQGGQKIASSWINNVYALSISHVVMLCCDKSLTKCPAAIAVRKSTGIRLRTKERFPRGKLFHTLVLMCFRLSCQCP